MGTLIVNDIAYNVLRERQNDAIALMLDLEDGQTFFLNRQSGYRELGKTAIFKVVYGDFKWHRPLLDGSDPLSIDMSKLTRDDPRISYLWSVRIPGKNPPPLTREQGALIGLKFNEASETFDGYA